MNAAFAVSGVAILIVLAVAIVTSRRRAAGAPPSIAPPTADEKERVEAAVSQAGAFMSASMLMVDTTDLNEGKTQKVGTYMYLVGAVDALCQHYKLSESAFQAASYGALRNFGLSESNALGICSMITEMSTDPFGRKAMIEGGGTVQAWLSGSNPNAPIRLFELVQEWRANPESGF